MRPLRKNVQEGNAVIPSYYCKGFESRDRRPEDVNRDSLTPEEKEKRILDVLAISGALMAEQ